MNKVTNWARHCDYPVIFVQHEQAVGAMEYGSSGWQLQGNLVTKEVDIIVRKTTF
jgi:hypothetical protein